MVALATPFTRDHLLQADYIAGERVARDPEGLCRIVEEILAAGA